MIKIIKILNSAFMSLFLGLILCGILMTYEMFYYAALTAILVGIFQFVSYVIIMLNVDFSEQRTFKKKMYTYLIAVILYFVYFIIIVILTGTFDIIEYLIYPLYIIPVLLSIFFTVLIEKIKL